MWRIRLGRELPRYLLCAGAIWGLLASARYAIAPPRPAARVSEVSTAAPDRAAEAYAALFARRYLTWNAAEPQSSARLLESFLGPGMESGPGLQLPAAGAQRVDWAEVAQMREPAPGRHVYTIAVQTAGAGLIYLSVTVQRTATGTLELGGYPAFVGAPAANPAEAGRHLSEVEEPALASVVGRALRNYLAGSAEELAADLTSSAQVSLPAITLNLQSLERLDWLEAGRTVDAVVQAVDPRGTQYVLAYELEVVRQQGRWEVAAVQTNPDS